MHLYRALHWYQATYVGGLQEAGPYMRGLGAIVGTQYFEPTPIKKKKNINLFIINCL